MTQLQPRLLPAEYAALVEQAPILIWRANTEGLCDYFNQRWLDFTGRSMAEEYGNGWAEGVHPEDLQPCLDFYLDHFHRRAVFEMEYRLRRHDGAWRWIFDRGVPMNDAGGAFAGYIGSCTDVTERVEARDALAQAQRALAEAQATRIRNLQGLLPICMFCKKIKSDKGYWEGLEQYILEHSGANFSHSLCPDCYPRYMDQIKTDGEELRRESSRSE